MITYDIKDYRVPIFTVDSVLFSVDSGSLNVLLVKRNNEPFKGKWGLPGGFIDIDNDVSAEQAAIRKIVEKTGAQPQYLQQLHTFSSPKRDPRGFSVTLSFYAMIAYQAVASQLSSIEAVKFIDVDQALKKKLAFDHHQIIKMALSRIQQKALYSMVPAYCLPNEFTMTDYKNIIEIILGQSIQRKSLIRRVEASDMFEPLNKFEHSGRRPAQLYRLKKGIEPYHFQRNMTLSV